MPHSRRLPTAIVTLATCLGVGLVVVAARQATEVPAARVMVQPTAPPAGDAGLVDDGQPRVITKLSRRAGRQVEASWPYERGKVIVKFRSGGTSGTRSAAVRAVGGTEVYTPSYADFDVMRIDPAADAEAVANALMERADVEYAQAAYRVYPYFKPNDPLYDRQWNFPAIGMEQAWDINPGATPSTIVAVLDTGVAFQNATYQFVGRSLHAGWRALPCAGPGVDSLRGSARTRRGARASCRRATSSGRTPTRWTSTGTARTCRGPSASSPTTAKAWPAWRSTCGIMPVKCIASVWDDIFDSPNVGTDDVVARAIRYAADNGAKVINMSLGRSGGPPARR